MNKKVTRNVPVKEKEEKTYKITVSYFENCDVIQLESNVEMKFPKKALPLLKDAVLSINSDLIVGFFDFQYQKKCPSLSFCFAQPCAKDVGLNENILSEFVNIVVQIQNEFGPCFKAIGNGEINDMKELELFMTKTKCRA